MVAQMTKYITGDAAFAVDRHGEVVIWNHEAEKLFGLTQDEALGRKCWKLLSGKDMFGNRYCCENCPLMEMAARRESPHGFPISFRTAQHGWQNFTLNSLLLFGNSGKEQLLHICHPPEETPDPLPKTNGIIRNLGHLPKRSLTDRELEVLELLAEGKATHEIASLMCISEATVRNHVQHLLGKLHVHNRLEAVVIGQRLDLI